MAQYRMLIIRGEDQPNFRDAVTNTFYLDTDGDFFVGTGPGNLAYDAAELFGDTLQPVSGFSRVMCKAYNMSDAKPRLPVAEEVYTSPLTPAAGGPREVALCLSYYAGVNQPRRRGRMYIGPWSKGAMDERPSSGLRSNLADLAEGISGLGGVNVQWVQYSPSTGDFTNVSDYWIDDEWDTQRSRGLRGEERTTGTVSG